MWPRKGDRSERARIDDRRGAGGIETPKAGGRSSFHTASAESGLQWSARKRQLLTNCVEKLSALEIGLFKGDQGLSSLPFVEPASFYTVDISRLDDLFLLRRVFQHNRPTADIHCTGSGAPEPTFASYRAKLAIEPARDSFTIGLPVNIPQLIDALAYQEPRPLGRYSI